MTKPETRRLLRRFGLTVQEARGYVTILERGEVLVSEIAKEIESTAGYVYQFLPSLERRGLVVVDEHVRPKLVRAVPPEDVVDNLRETLAVLETGLLDRSEGGQGASGTDSDGAPTDPPPSESLLDAFETFGVSNTEAEVYLAALDAGEATVSELTNRMAIPHQQVSRSVTELADRSFLQRDDVESDRLRAVPPAVVVERLSDQLDALDSALHSLFTEIEQSRPPITTATDPRTAVKRLQKLIGDADEAVRLLIPEEALGEVSLELQQAMDRGVFVRLLVGVDDDTPDLALTPGSIAGLGHIVRAMTERSILCVVDDTACLMAGGRLLTVSERTDAKVIVVGQSDLVRYQRQEFDKKWDEGTEMYLGEPNSLPLVRTNFEVILFHAARHLDGGTPLRAAVEVLASDATSNETETVSGPVEDIETTFLSDSPANSRNRMTLESDRGQLYIHGGMVEEPSSRDFVAHRTRLERDG